MFSSGSAYYVSSGSIMPMSAGFSGFAPLSVVYSDTYHKWMCHYCGSLVKPELDQCSKCGGERRSQPTPYQSAPKIKYAEDEMFNVNMNIATPPKSVWSKIKMALGDK